MSLNMNNRVGTNLLSPPKTAKNVKEFNILFMTLFFDKFIHA